MEAVEQWKYAVRRMSEHLPRFEETTVAPGVDAIWGNIMFPLVNHAFVTEPLDDAGIALAAEAVSAYGNERKVPWMFAVPAPLAPSTFPLSAAGLEIAMRLTYMETDRILDPVRPLPAVEIRPIETQAECETMSDVNSVAYGMPAEWVREACSIAAWNHDAYGAVGYLDSEPVSTATVLINGDVMNVVCVATTPQHQGRGYAEAVMRHVLAESASRWGLSRTVLHATEAGYPVYLRMGYQPSVKFGLWSPADGGH